MSSEEGRTCHEARGNGGRQLNVLWCPQSRIINHSGRRCILTCARDNEYDKCKNTTRYHCLQQNVRLAERSEGGRVYAGEKSGTPYMHLLDSAENVV
eukprot:scaffold2689_cov641-Pavlova_lutheri.AAC.3